ncbi:hypothetical protein ACHAW5_007608 [Stephanodiscus triporus]|uniref:RING-type E3 ubiquitin transferase n=1 Tax=Stephanodiscus triporus TaxID=2934178 RepID=A0ABD3MJ71_9STRA
MSKRPPTHPNPPAPPANAGEELVVFNPVSKWQEYVEVPGLTLFDIHREPRRENEDPDARVRIQLKVLGPEFHCPVCLGYIRNTRIVKECLHRFCYDCIEKCLRVGKKQCPQCRIHIPSRRSFRPDTNFDELIKSIYGDIEELEKLEELEIEKLNKKNMNNAYAESRKRGMLHQAEQRKRKAAIPGLLGETVTPPARGNAGLKESPLIEIILRRHPQETAVDRLRKEYIRTSKEMTMETLKIFLGRKLGYSPYQHFQILAIADEDAVVLPNDITLAVVHREICDNPMNREMILYYRILPEIFDYTG